MNPYEVLKIDTDATDDEIRKAYRILSKACHPDIHGEEARPLFENLKKAHDILMDPDQRTEYDEFGTTSGSEKSKKQEIKGRAISIIIDMVNQFSRAVMNQGYHGEDFIETISDGLKRSAKEGEKSLEGLNNRIKNLSDFITRMKSKEGKLTAIIESQKNIMKIMVEDRSNNRKMLEAVNLAIDLMDDLDFDTDFEDLMKIQYEVHDPRSSFNTSRPSRGFPFRFDGGA